MHGCWVLRRLSPGQKNFNQHWLHITMLRAKLKLFPARGFLNIFLNADDNLLSSHSVVPKWHTIFVPFASSTCSAISVNPLHIKHAWPTFYLPQQYIHNSTYLFFVGVECHLHLLKLASKCSTILMCPTSNSPIKQVLWTLHNFNIYQFHPLLETIIKSANCM